MIEAAGAPARSCDEDAIGTPPASPTLVPTERYYSAAFAALKIERMWPKVWQLACMVDHIAESGDYVEYRCGPYGALVVRGDDGVLRAFQSACRHRGNSLYVDAGSGLRELKCGYHGWTWDLAGTLKRVPNRKGFGSLRMSDFHCYATLTVDVEANWKTIADGYSETYHVQTLHPELLRCVDDIHAPQQIWLHAGAPGPSRPAAASIWTGRTRTASPGCTSTTCSRT